MLLIISDWEDGLRVAPLSNPIPFHIFFSACVLFSSRVSLSHCLVHTRESIKIKNRRLIRLILLKLSAAHLISRMHTRARLDGYKRKSPNSDRIRCFFFF